MRWARICLAIAFVAASIVGQSHVARADDVSSARARATKAAQALSDAETKLAELEVEIADLTRQATEAQNALGGLHTALREMAIGRYVRAGNDEEVLFVGTDLERQAKVDAFERFLVQGSRDSVDRYRALSEDLATANAALDSKASAQRKAVSNLRARRQQLAQELARLEAIEAKKQTAARARAASARAGRSAPSGPIVSGAWVCPVQGSVSFVDSWGAPRSGGRRHQGVDMMASRGTPVVAPVSGRVTHRGNSVGGLSFHLNGDDGHYYYGTHLSAYANQGAGHVQAGTIIGYVGDTGNARGTPHLHFEIHPNGGRAVNPYPTVRKYC